MAHFLINPGGPYSIDAPAMSGWSCKLRFNEEWWGEANNTAVGQLLVAALNRDERAQECDNGEMDRYAQ